MSVIETVKEHPMAVGAAVVGLAVIYLVFFRGASAPSTYSTDTSNSVGAATALQTTAMQVAAHNSEIQGAVQANQDTIAGQIELAKIQGATSTNNNEILANVQLANIGAAQQVQSLVSTLEAGVATNAQNSEVQKTSIIVGGQTDQQRILADALINQSREQANVAIAAIGKQAQHSCGLFGKIFGC